MRSRLRNVRLTANLAILLAFCLPDAARAVELHLADDSLFDPATAPPPTGHLPVLFVHGHNATSDDDADFNYRKDWRQPLNGLPSFQQALDQNSGLGIEPYYVRFVDQNRSIVEDAREIGEAVDLILRRHDPAFDPADPGSTTSVQVAIIAFSKGTISTRLYLKSLQGLEPAIPPPPQTAFHRVSEFIAISPPNHGINVSGFGAFTSLAVQQLLNGYGAATCVPLPAAAARDFIATLNGHPIADTATLDAGDVYPDEAPGSRPDGAPPTAGTLYVTLFADGNRDLVGGDSVPGNNDCQGRRLALNLAPHAINIPLTAITGSTAAGVHQNTVHTADVMCLALYAALHHRSPFGQSCQLTNGLPVIPPPAQAAAMLTLDFSGSMAAPACPGCATRAAVLKESVELFVRLWSAVGRPADRLGVTYFRSDVVQPAFDSEILPLLGAKADDIIMSVDNQMPGGATAMGGGLQRSIEALGSPAAGAAASRHVILFTDGMQNVNPMVRAVAGHHEIANEPGRPDSGVMPTNIRLDQVAGIAVDTIGIGSGQAFVGLLQDIATETGGHALITQAPDQQLRRFFVEILINALRGFSPQLVAYRHGTIGPDGGRRETFAVEDGGRKLVLKLSWKRGATIDFSVLKDGADVTAAGRFIAGDFYRIYVIDLPAKGADGRIGARGDWQLRISGKAGTPYEVAAIIDTHRTRYDAAFAERSPRVGDRVSLQVRLGVDGRPVEGQARVTATLQAPQIALGNVIATRPAVDPDKLRGLEPGAAAAERALLGVAQSPRQWAALQDSGEWLSLAPDGKGGFSAAFRARRPGVYRAVVEIVAADSALGSFTRTLTATTVVGFGKVSAKTTALIVSQASAADRRYVTVIVAPRDSHGNHLGPGLSTIVGLELSTGRTIGGAHDLGDGRYLFLVAAAAGDDPAMTLTVGDDVLFAGRLSALARRTSR